MTIKNMIITSQMIKNMYIRNISIIFYNGTRIYDINDKTLIQSRKYSNVYINRNYVYLFRKSDRTMFEYNIC